jgi:hypothetical protein
MRDLDAGPEPVRIPADVDREDRLLADLTARQVALLAAGAAGLWLAWVAARHLTSPAVFAVAAAPAAVAVVMLAVGKRDGLSLDRWLAAALRHASAPRRLVPAPGGVLPPPGWVTRAAAAQARPLPAPLRLPATAITPAGLITLDGGACVAVAAASTVNFALRTPAEQQALTAAFGRWLNSLQHPAQILIRAHRIDLAEMSARIRSAAATLPHPALERAAIGHAAFLDHLAQDRDLLARQVLLAVSEPGPGPAARRIGESARALAAAGLTVSPLHGAQAAAVLAACCNPGQPPPAATGPAERGRHRRPVWPGRCSMRGVPPLS